MNKPKPGHDKYGWPKYDAAWWWHQATRPAFVIAVIIAVIIELVLASMR